MCFFIIRYLYFCLSNSKLPLLPISIRHKETLFLKYQMIRTLATYKQYKWKFTWKIVYFKNYNKWLAICSKPCTLHSVKIALKQQKGKCIQICSSLNSMAVAHLHTLAHLDTVIFWNTANLLGHCNIWNTMLLWDNVTLWNIVKHYELEREEQLTTTIRNMR